MAVLLARPQAGLSSGCLSFLEFPPQALFGQLLLGLINGSFYAILSLGLAVIFGLLNIINFTHGAQYMMGAFVAWMFLNYSGSAIGGR
jgi:branched-chain amino acid transport system permease protein